MRKFRPNHVGQNYLLPPDVNEWLSESHFARFLQTLVTDELDLNPIRLAYQSKMGRGAPPYDPAMMTAVLLYGYCIGMRSSRHLEEATYDDLGLRFLTANQHPDHDSIATFRKRHLPHFQQMFRQVLQLCAEVGLIKVGEIDLYLDGTKMLANASRHQTVSYAKVRKTQEQLHKQIDQILQEAEEIDAAEDELYGSGKRGGGDVPADLADPKTARERLRAARERLAKADTAREQMEREARAEAEQQVAEAAARREDHEQMHKRGRKPVVPDVETLTEEICHQKRINLTDRDSRLMLDGATKAIVQAYNCQAVATAGSQIIVACEATTDENDLHQLAPMAHLAGASLVHLGIDPEITCKLGADAGYLTISGVTDERSSRFDLYIAAGRETSNMAENTTAENTEADQNTTDPPRCGGFIMYVEPPKIPNPKIPKPQVISPFAQLQEQMREKNNTEVGAAFYAQRSATIEPIFGQTKENRGIRRLMMRGLPAARAEWGLICLTHNILKLYRHKAKNQNEAKDRKSSEYKSSEYKSSEKESSQKESERSFLKPARHCDNCMKASPLSLALNLT